MDSQPSAAPAPDQGTEPEDIKDDGIVTTPEEIEGYHIVRAILSQILDPERVELRDTKSYCGILLDHNNRKPLCRFYFTPKQKYMTLLDKERNEEKIVLQNVSDIGKYADRLIEYAKIYL